MEKTYSIIWVAKHKETSGLGTKRFSREDAENLAAELNERHSAFIHRAFDTAREDQQRVTMALRAAGKSPDAQNLTYPDFVAAQAAAVIPAPVLLPAVEEKVFSLDAPSVRPAAAGE